MEKFSFDWFLDACTLEFYNEVTATVKNVGALQYSTICPGT